MGIEPAARESVILIPVPEATPLLRQHRLQYDPSAPANVPEHITIHYPFLPPDTLDDALIARLREFFRAIPPFSFTLTRTGWFEQGVLFLVPDPLAPFADATRRLSDLFGILPFEGRYWPEVNPHLTIAQHGPRDILAQIAADVTTHLPIHARAREAVLMVGHNETGWAVRDRFPFESAPRVEE
jgi:2'-5' RNA ligase